MSKLLAGLVLIGISINTYSYENVIGVDFLNINASGDQCDPYPDDFGCETDSDSFRIYYGARFTEQLELRLAWSQLDIKLTDQTDAFFNSPDVSSEIYDLQFLYRWHLSDSWHVHAKAGLGYWTESLPGAGFFDSSGSENGVSPALGAEVEWGSRLVRLGAGIDLYPSIGDTGLVTIANLGVKFVW